MQIHINEVMRQALADHKEAEGLTNAQLAGKLGVTAPTMSRWLNGRTHSMDEATWASFLAVLGVPAELFDQLTMLGKDTQATLKEEAKEKGAAERIAHACGVSKDTVETWAWETCPVLRDDVWEKLGDHLGLGEDDAEDCLPITAVDLKEMDEKVRTEKGADREKVRAEQVGVPRLCRGDSVKVIIWGDALPKVFGEAHTLVTVLGRAKDVGAVRGLSSSRTLVIEEVDALTDGERVVVQEGEELIVGTLRFVPVVVLEDGGEIDQQ
jgi:transcriptional regulator with XRE-family HTH domain